jgi:hypothetical protein
MRPPLLDVQTGLRAAGVVTDRRPALRAPVEVHVRVRVLRTAREPAKELLEGRGHRSLPIVGRVGRRASGVRFDSRRALDDPMTPRGEPPEPEGLRPDFGRPPAPDAVLT